MDIDEEINEDKDIEDIYDDESDSFAPEDINDELEKNTNISESEVCKNKFSNNMMKILLKRKLINIIHSKKVQLLILKIIYQKI